MDAYNSVLVQCYDLANWENGKLGSVIMLEQLAIHSIWLQHSRKVC